MCAWYNSLKDLTHDAGHYLSESGKLAGYVPGVGPLVGGAMTAAGGVLEGDPLKDALVNGAKAGITQYGVGKLAGAIGSKIPGIAGVTRALGSGGGPAASSSGGADPSDPSTWDPSDPTTYLPPSVFGGGATVDPNDPFGSYGQGPSGSAPSGGHWYDGIVRALPAAVGGGGGTDVGGLALGGLAAYQALNAANASKRAGQFQDKAISTATDLWNQGAPLRTQGQATLLNPVRPDLSGTYVDPNNPFARPRALAGGGR